MRCPCCAQQTLSYLLSSDAVAQAALAQALKEAVIAWEVCASLHERFAKPGTRSGKDALYTTRQADFRRHAEDARQQLAALSPPADQCNQAGQK